MTGSSRKNRKLLRWTGWFVALSATAAAIPLGLNRPVYWLIFGVIVAIWTIGFILLAHRDQARHITLHRSNAWLLAIAAIVPAWAIVQSVPLPFEQVGPGGVALSILPSASAMGALRFTIYILFFYLALIAGARQNQAHRVAILMFAGAVAHAAWGLVALNLLGDVALWGEKTAYLGFATGTFLNRNSFATFLSIGFCLGTALLFDTGAASQRGRRGARTGLDEWLNRALVLLGLVVIGLALFATQSRLGVAGALIGAVICFVLMRTGAATPSLRRFLVTFAIAIPVLAVAATAWGVGLLDRVISIEESVAFRLVAYGYALELIHAEPLLGYGFDTFRLAFESVHRPPLPGDFYWDRAHSTYLSNWVELGVVIGSLPVLLVAVVCLRLAKSVYSSSEGAMLPAAAFSAIVTAAFQSAADFGLEIPANVILLLALSGLALASSGQAHARRT
ncbi:MAG: O-antigen ligase family protein [Pseudomonadota bacterium]